MATEKIFKMSVGGLLVLLIVSLLLSALPPLTHYKTNNCEGTTTGHAEKTQPAAKSDIDIESLSGKFFSSISY